MIGRKSLSFGVRSVSSLRLVVTAVSGLRRSWISICETSSRVFASFISSVSS